MSWYLAMWDTCLCGTFSRFGEKAYLLRCTGPDYVGHGTAVQGPLKHLTPGYVRRDWAMWDMREQHGSICAAQHQAKRYAT